MQISAICADEDWSSLFITMWNVFRYISTHPSLLESISPQLAHTRATFSLISDWWQKYIIHFSHTELVEWDAKAHHLRIYMVKITSPALSKYTHNSDFIFAKRVSYFIHWSNYLLTSSLASCGVVYGWDTSTLN